MLKKIKTTTKVNIPFLGEKNINIPLVIGVSAAAVGALYFLMPTIAPQLMKEESSANEKKTIEDKLADPQLAANERATLEAQLRAANEKLRLEQQKSASQQSKIEAEQNAANNPPIPIGSVCLRLNGQNAPYFHKEAAVTKWKSLLGLIENNLKSNFYRGKNKYVANEAGEIIPSKFPIEETSIFHPYGYIDSLSKFIVNGGVWIDYTDYPLYFPDGQYPFGRDYAFNDFCMYLDSLGVPEIEKLGYDTYSNINSNFWVRQKFSTFAYERSLTILRETPSKRVFLTSTMIPELKATVPYDDRGVYSMFAIRYRNGIYFYSNRGNSPYDYSMFIKAVHGWLI